MRRLAYLLLAALAAAPAAAGVEREWRFRVLLEEREIGSHDFRVIERGGEREVQSRARFEVRWLFVNAYRYVHESREIWRDNCLREISARTDDNGTILEVRGAGENAGFELTGPAGRARLARCVMTFAYWNPAFLGQARLLNPQTGELTAVRVEPAGEEMLTVRGAPVLARRYALHAPGYRIDVWYAGDSTEWVQLESRTANGRRLRYVAR
jgi:hypothetical protein